MKDALNVLLKNLANLIKVKSLITLTIIWTISFLVCKGVEIPPEYSAFAGSIVTYFFTKTQNQGDV